MRGFVSADDRFDRRNHLDLYHGPGRAHRYDELYGGLLLGYLALLAAAGSIYLEKDFGLDALAGALLLLAIVNIRNAWDLTLTMVRRHPRDD